LARKESIKYSFPKLLQIFKKFWPEIHKYRLLIAGSFAALMAEVVLRLLEPWPLKFIFDRVIPTDSSKHSLGISLLDSLDPLSLIIFASVSLVLLTGLRALASYACKVGFALVGNRVITKVRDDLYNHIQCLPLSFHTKSKAGDLLVRMTGDVGLLQEVTVTAALPLIGNFMVLMGMMGVMLWLNFQLALIALIIIPFFWISIIRRGGRIREVSRKQRKTESALAATAAESMTAIKTVQALSLEETFSKSFSSNSQKNLTEGVKGKRLTAGLERSVDLLVALGTALVLGYGAVLVLSNELTPGDLIVFLAYLKNAFKPLRNFAKYTARLAKAAAAGERIVELLDITPEIKNKPDAITAPPFKGSVDFENVSFAYDDKTPVLQNIDINIKPGQCVALIAPSGSGKSTLVSLLMRLYDPNSGCIKIDGNDIKSYSLSSLRSQISVVLQDTLLFATNMWENIAYGAKDCTEEKIVSCAKLANTHDFISALPQGYDTAVGERGVTLSNGQRQRIAIARAAIRNSPILILDEPTTGLDKENEREVNLALAKISKGKTTFLITHNLNSVAHADKIIFLENGQIIEQGTHCQLIEEQGRYSTLLNKHGLAPVF
jgi:ATP-binding cassette subfamily B protein